VAGAVPRCLQARHQFLGRQAPVLGQRGAEHRRDDRLVGAAEGLEELALEHAQARGR